MSPRRVTLTVIGDGTVGKTALFKRYVDGTIPERYTQTVFENTSKMIKIGNETFDTHFWDTAGQEGYDKLRALAYVQTSVYLMCYAVDNRKSYDNCRALWAPEVLEYKKCPIVLIATKVDLIDSRKQAIMMGINLAKSINAAKFYVTSALTGEGVEEAIHGSCLVSMAQRKCVIL